MTTNIGGVERIVRVVGGLVLVALAATGQVGVWGWVGLVPSTPQPPLCLSGSRLWRKL